MPEAAIESEENATKEKSKKTKDKEQKMKKSVTSNGLSSFAKGKLVLARVNMLDGTVNDFSIEVCVLIFIMLCLVSVLIHFMFMINIR